MLLNSKEMVEIISVVMKRRVFQYVIVSAGCLLSAIGINLFSVPYHFYSGGISGIALVLYYLFAWPVGLQIFVANVPLLYAAYRLLGKEYTLVAIWGTVVFSFFIDATSSLTSYNLLDDQMLAALVGGVVSGIGSGLVFRVNGSAGGLDIISAIVKKLYSLNMGFAGFLFNCAIMLVAAVLFGVKLAVFTLISMYISGVVTDGVVQGFNRRKIAIIISEKAEELAKSVIAEVGRGVTYLHGEGAFTGQYRKVVFLVVTLTQVAKVKEIIEDVDPVALMILHDAAEVAGRGFTLPMVHGGGTEPANSSVLKKTLKILLD